MAIWKVNDEKEVVLYNVVIKKCTFGTKDVSYHFMGIDQYGGRVSSAIQTLSLKDGKWQGVTRSGRIYTVESFGMPEEDADYVWYVWRANNKVVRDENIYL